MLPFSRASLEAQSEAINQHVMQTLGPLHNGEGLHEANMEHYFRALGQPVHDLIALDNVYMPETQAALRASGLNFEEQSFGQYFIIAKAAIINRDTMNHRDPLLPEHLAIHEGAHASPLPTNLLKGLVDKIGLWPATKPTSGLRTSEDGVFGDEGRAEFMAGGYDQEIRGVHGVIEGPHGLYPAKYQLWDEIVGAESGASYRHPALAWELLAAKNPKIVEPLFALPNDQSVLPELVAEIDAVRPGLFAHMQRIRRFRGASNEFLQGLQLVSRVTGLDLAKDVEAVAEEGPITLHIRHKLAAYEASGAYTFERGQQPAA